MDNLKLNDTISFYRKKHGLTQEELAQKLGVTNQSVSKWESAQCCPDISLLPKLASIFDISLDELFGIEPNLSDICEQFPLREDDIFRVVVARGKQIVSVENLDKTIDITFPKNCDENGGQCYKIEVFGNIKCSASIKGNVISHGRIECNQINGDIKECRDSISCQGNISGGVSADNNISCGIIYGGVHCGNNLNSGHVHGSVVCENNVFCGNITGDVSCDGNVECKKIEGDVECHGNIIYK